MDFEPYFKVHNLASVHPKSIILGQMTNLNMILHVLVSVYRLVKIGNSPQFPDELSMSMAPFTENICTILNARALTVWRRKLDVTKESSCASVTNKFHSGKLCSAPPTKFFPYADVRKNCWSVLKCNKNEGALVGEMEK